MNNLDIIRAWKDEAYRASLGIQQQALLPAHPAGNIEDMEAAFSEPWPTARCTSICVL